MIKRLTLARAKMFAKRAAKDNGLDIAILDAKWQGQGGVDSSGLRWRSARVLITQGTRQVWKVVCMDVSGWVSVS